MNSTSSAAALASTTATTIATAAAPSAPASSTVDPSATTTNAATGTLAGEQSPQHNPNAFSVFAPVIIPDRSSLSSWSGTPLHTRMAPVDNNNGEVAVPAPHLPRKPAAHVWSNNPTLANASTTDAFSPSLPEHLQLQSLPDSNTFADSDAPPSPLPKLVVSPRHETGNRSPFHGRMQYSPTHSIASTVTLMGMAGGNLAADEVSPQTGGFYYNSANQGHTGAVPISPHVNVPAASNLEYRAVPPPLPPRRKERTDSCADMAQKRQAPDAPTVSVPFFLPKIFLKTFVFVRSYPRVMAN